MALTAADIIASPEVYPFALDVQRQLLQLVRMTRTDYRAASFLDGRMLTPAMEIGGAPVAVLAQAAKRVKAKPLRFIFHTGHVGSTLLSRLLDEVPGVLSLREPLPLRSLADHPDPQILETLLLLWSRGYEDTHHVIVKASSMAGTLAPMMLEAAPESRGVYLHLKAEPYLATIIAGSDTVKDQAAFAYPRMVRIAARLRDNAIPQPQSPGEYAALTFLAEGVARADALAAQPERMLGVDFEDLLADVDGMLAAIIAHFQLPQSIPQAAIAQQMGRYSKAPDSAYSPALRAQILDEARTKAGHEIRGGLAWLENIAARHAVVADLL
jgi:hypothetical protein